MTQAAGPRCLGLDVGTARIGVAVHAPGTDYAMPHQTVEARDNARACQEIIATMKEREIDTLVVGWPLDMDGSAGRATRRVDIFLDKLGVALLASQLEPAIVRWDERLTTTAAEAMLVGANLSRKRRKQVVDKIAAVYILEGYLKSLTHHDAD